MFLRYKLLKHGYYSLQAGRLTTLGMVFWGVQHKNAETKKNPQQYINRNVRLIGPFQILQGKGASQMSIKMINWKLEDEEEGERGCWKYMQ